jgi:uncharacterized membrane protein YdjX (TVP38/TMEM64 family)
MAETQTATGAAPTRRKLPLARIGLGIAGLLALVLLARWAGARIDAFEAFVQGLGWWGPVVFVLGYAVGVVGFVPGSALTLAAGAIFGLGSGVAYVFTAAVLGSTASFLIARYLARAAVERRIAGNPRFAAIDRAIGRDGLKITLLLRLSPAFPFSLLNYVLGLTRVSLRDYLIAAAGMLPGTVLYVYTGKLAADVASAAAGGAAPEGARALLLGIGLLATAAVTVLITRVARRALAEATGE